jgi:hypothetical protein
MIRRLVSTVAPLAVAFAAVCGAAVAQPYAGEPDPYTLPPGYNQVTGYDQPGYAPGYEGPAQYEPQDQGDYQQDAPPAAYPPEYEGPAHYEPAPSADAYGGQDRGGYYNSGTGAQVSSTYSRQGYVRGGESYSSRERNTSQEAYVGGQVYADDRGGYATTGTPVYVDENGVSRDGGYVRGSSHSSQSGYSSAYDSRYGDGRAEQYGSHQDSRYGDQSGERSGYADAGSYEAYAASSARFGYQRRFYAFSVAEEEYSNTSVRRDEFGYVRRYQPRPYPWRNDDLHLDVSTQLALTGGVEGESYVASSSGGGYATASASASAGARAGAFAGARGGRGKGHHGRPHGCGCRR